MRNVWLLHLLSVTFWGQSSAFLSPALTQRPSPSSLSCAGRAMSRTSRLFSAPANNDLDQQDSSVSERVNLIPNVETVDEEPDGEDRRFGLETYVLTQAVLIGVLSGWAVGVFKLSIEGVRKLFYGLPCLAYHPALLILVPMVGGLLVGLLSMWGSFPPGLRGTVLAVDKQQDSRPGRSFGFLRKTMAAVFTLGTGCSLGPEGPSVEVGMAMSRICINEFPLEDRNASNLESKRNRSRLLLACGAAAGVAAGFNAPIAGVFFALEIVQGAFQSVLGKRENVATATSGNISAILLASVLSALVSKALLGEHLVFELGEYTLRTPLLELPLYLLLGAVSGIIAFTFEKTALFSKNVFDGQVGPKPLRQFAEKMPKPVKPVIGGLICGVAGLAFPQILFFGYETLNSLLANSSLPTGLMLWLLVLKILTTAISAGSGLVGGTFAPSLFLGGMVGASFHNLVILLFTFATSGGGGSLQIAAGGPILELADVPAYAMVGSASVLAALFRAPLTASLLLFELTRDYDVILPLMASAGVGSLVNDMVEQKFERLRRREEDAVSWGDLADKE